MPSIRYYNQTAPFWDFVANLEEQGTSHPLFGGAQNHGEAPGNEHPPNPWLNGWGGFPFGPMPYRGGHGPHHSPMGPPPPPPGATHTPPPPEYEENSGGEAPPEKERDAEDAEEGPSDARGSGRHGRRARHSRVGPDRHHGPGFRRSTSAGRCGGRGRGDFGGRFRGGPFRPHQFNPAGGFGALAELFQSQLWGENATKDGDEDFKPEVDVFDTAESFIVHISLPGAKKEDVGVNWDAEKSELIIAGVIYRPADEETLKSLALDERKVGAFERKLRLGSRAHPAQVNVDAIIARLEDGILRVDVPKLDNDYVEVKKVDIE